MPRKRSRPQTASPRLRKVMREFRKAQRFGHAARWARRLITRKKRGLALNSSVAWSLAPKLKRTFAERKSKRGRPTYLRTRRKHPTRNTSCQLAPSRTNLGGMSVAKTMATSSVLSQEAAAASTSLTVGAVLARRSTPARPTVTGLHRHGQPGTFWNVRGCAAA